MVFAAGLGRRMRPLTEKLPKPLVRVAGKTLIDHMLDRCADAGVRKAVVNVHHLADQIEAHLTPRRRPRIVISDERSKLLDQGGGIRKALPELGRKPFFICNTDALWLEGPRSNLRRFTAAWDPERMDVLLLVADTATSVGVDWPGDFSMDADGRLAKRDERLVAPFVYAGVGILKPELFAGVSAEIFKLAPFFFAAAERGRLFGMRLDGIWLHVGTPDAIVAADRAIDRSLL
ncbi:MAG: nucleotidyltransferase family protein [Methylobacteriaceae bacterium]|nr:nucleotidyltransferase family protein [Methylobacteriaceae bacterium]